MVKVGIVGGTGYTGVELLRILARHGEAELIAITSRTEDGMPVAELFPSLRGSIGLNFSDPAKADLSRCDVVFFATPRGVAMEQAPRLVEMGVRVIDLGPDFRLKDLAEWQRWYGVSHACPKLAEEAVYGLPDLTCSGAEKEALSSLALPKATRTFSKSMRSPTMYQFLPTFLR